MSGGLAARGVAKGLRAGRDHIRALNRAARCKCECGGDKHEQHEVCFECWKAAPEHARLNLRSDNFTARMLALRALHEVAKSRKPTITAVK